GLGVAPRAGQRDVEFDDVRGLVLLDRDRLAVRGIPELPGAQRGLFEGVDRLLDSWRIDVVRLEDDDGGGRAARERRGDLVIGAQERRVGGQLLVNAQLRRVHAERG